FGLHTGEAERRGADYYGAALNLAARIRGEADGGEVLCSTTTGEVINGRLPDGYQLGDLGVHRLQGIRRPEQVLSIPGHAVPGPFSSATCPYPGMLAFDVGDHDIFFGRERVVDSIFERLGDGPVLAVVGASGSGKSSVLRAGVLAAVRAGDVSKCSEGSI